MDAIAGVTGNPAPPAAEAALDALASDGRRRGSAAPGQPGAGERRQEPAGNGPEPTRPFAIAPADVAAVERWLARVWPGIPLGGGADPSLAIGGIAAGLLRPGAGVARLLVAAPPLVQLAKDRAPAGPSRPQPPNGPDLSLFGASLPAAWKEVLFLVALALFAAAMVFTFWKEKGSAPRARPR